ncbi:suppressor of rasval19 [Zalaria obscura]|uniref:Suppressor of rasval19 n=1 Tax=Zalaria obscura TaxID=2024903 RepID=A0ACC3S7L3_9PEZI
MAPQGGQGGMYNLTTLIKRLEAATSRLEDIASSTASFEQPTANGAPSGTVHQTSSMPELPTVSGDSPQPPSQPAAPAQAALPATIIDMDNMITGDLKKFVDAGEGLDKIIADQSQAVSRAFTAQRQFLLVSTKSKKPDMTSPDFSDLIKDLQKEMSTVNDIRESNRASQYKDHLAMVGEGMGALQWVVFEGKPADYVAEILGGVQLFGNRVLKEYKEKDPKHVAFVQSYYSLWKSLQGYIRTHYPTGLTWNNSPTGIELGEALKQVQQSSSSSVPPAPAPPAAAAGGPPPPPPPPPLPKFDNDGPPAPPPPGAKSAGGASDMGAVFDQLNRGEAVTSGLRKVDKSQMTHKNPSLRAGSEVPGLERSRSRGPETKPKPASMKAASAAAAAPVKKEGRKELDGNKWIIENFDGPSEPIEIEVSLTQSVLITKCNKTTIRLIGKANAVSIDNSARCNLIIDSLVSSVDVIKAPNFALQVLGTLPTIMLDQVDGAAVYLSKDSLNTEVFTSKCSSVNVNLPPLREEDDYKEVPLPEQIRTVVRDGQLVSEIVEHAG